MPDTDSEPTGGMFALLRYSDHPAGALGHCPSCGDDLTRIGVTSLAYTFEVCECGTPDYPHLVEQLWHRAHLHSGPDVSLRTAHLMEAAELVARQRSTIPPTNPARVKTYTEVAAFLRRVARGTS